MRKASPKRPNQPPEGGQVALRHTRGSVLALPAVQRQLKQKGSIYHRKSAFEKADEIANAKLHQYPYAPASDQIPSWRRAVSFSVPLLIEESSYDPTWMSSEVLKVTQDRGVVTTDMPRPWSAAEIVHSAFRARGVPCASNIALGGAEALTLRRDIERGMAGMSLAKTSYMYLMTKRDQFPGIYPTIGSRNRVNMQNKLAKLIAAA